jgi:hypothetical protein
MRKACLQKSYQNKWIWRDDMAVDYYCKGRDLVLRIPRAALGMNGKLDFEFKWVDNMQDEGNVMDFYVSGDAAPGGRFNYVFQE